MIDSLPLPDRRDSWPIPTDFDGWYVLPSWKYEVLPRCPWANWLRVDRSPHGWWVTVFEEHPDITSDRKAAHLRQLSQGSKTDEPA